MSSKFLSTRELRMLLSTTNYHGFAVRLVFPGDGTPLGADYRYVSKVDFREVDWDGHEASVLEARPEPSDSGARNATTVAMYLERLRDQDGYVQLYLREAGHAMYFAASRDVIVNREAMTIDIPAGDYISG